MTTRLSHLIFDLKTQQLSVIISKPSTIRVNGNTKNCVDSSINEIEVDKVKK